MHVAAIVLLHTSTSFVALVVFCGCVGLITGDHLPMIYRTYGYDSLLSLVPGTEYDWYCYIISAALQSTGIYCVREYLLQECRRHLQPAKTPETQESRLHIHMQLLIACTGTWY